ncbi:ATP-NAD kinase family protein [Thermococcus sp.]
MVGIRVGFIVNPIAGMGGRVALKGTDGVVEEAIRRGARPISPEIVRLFLRELTGYEESRDFEFLTGPGPLGEDYLREFRLHFRVLNHRRIRYREIHGIPIPDTTSEDTKALSKAMLGKVDIILFAGGDGTARDVYSVVGRSVPILGIPTGVKMFSGIFAVSPESAARVLVEFARGRARIEEREIMDINEDAFRKDDVKPREYGRALTPVFELLVQGSKEPLKVEEEGILRATAEAVAEELLERDGIYFLGSGSTVKMIKDLMGIDGTLLGVDVVEVKDKKARLLVKDATEMDLLKFVDKNPKVIVTVVGGLGFLFGRGNQQFSPKVLSKIPKENVIVVASPSKVEGGIVRVYTGDRGVDEKFRGYIRVRVSPWMEKIVRVL